jgi:hypothetical protein
VEFLDESKADHTHDITEEVKEESNDHLVCFVVSGAISAPVIGDLDGNGKPLGLESALSTGDTGTGVLQVTLKHLPEKASTAPCSTGDTDVDVTFLVTIE